MFRSLSCPNLFRNTSPATPSRRTRSEPASGGAGIRFLSNSSRSSSPANQGNEETEPLVLSPPSSVASDRTETTRVNVQVTHDNDPPRRVTAFRRGRMLPSQRAPAATQTIGRGPSAGRCNHSPTDHHHVCGLRTTACEHMEQVCAGARAAHAHGMFALGLATGILITAAWVKLSISD